MRNYVLSFCLSVVMLLGLQAGSMGAVAPLAPERVSNCADQGGKEGAVQAPVCVIAGTVYCSEYGSRYSNPLQLVLTDTRGRFTSSISDTNGSFAVVAPCGGGYDVTIEFADKKMAVGHIDLPPSPEGTVFTLELWHTGSYLELVRDIREGVGEDDITFKLSVPQTKD